LNRIINIENGKLHRCIEIHINITYHWFTY